jgi:hypothetical protein
MGWFETEQVILLMLLLLLLPWIGDAWSCSCS